MLCVYIYICVYNCIYIYIYIFVYTYLSYRLQSGDAHTKIEQYSGNADAGTDASPGVSVI